MRVLFINPPEKGATFPYSPSFLQWRVKFPPLNILYVASYLKNYTNHSIEVIDGDILENPFAEIEERIKAFDPDIIGISSFTPTFYNSYRIAKTAKSLKRNVHINIGGSHVYFYPEQTLGLECVDSITLGEGEMAFHELVERIESRRNIDGIRGIGYRHDGSIVINRNVEAIRDLDSLPFPDRTLLPINKYYTLGSYGEVVTAMITSRGCPYRCSFCAVPLKYPAYRTRSAPNVVDEIELCERLEISYIIMSDDIFNYDTRRVIEICNEKIRRDIKIKWLIQARADLLSEKMAEKLSMAGCDRICFGIESGSEEILDVYKKGIKLEEVREAVRRCKTYGIQTVGSFMIGAPGETRDQIKRTVDFAIELDTDYAVFHPMLPPPGTEIYRQRFMESGDDYILSFAINPTPDFRGRLGSTNMDEKEVGRLIRSAYMKFYLRPPYILKTLYRIGSIQELIKTSKVGVSIIKDILA